MQAGKVFLLERANYIIAYNYQYYINIAKFLKGYTKIKSV